MTCPAVVKVTVPSGPAVVRVAIPGPPGPQSNDGPAADSATILSYAAAMALIFG
jgi:hypothetical protein